VLFARLLTALRGAIVQSYCFYPKRRSESSKIRSKQRWGRYPVIQFALINFLFYPTYGVKALAAPSSIVAQKEEVRTSIDPFNKKNDGV